MDAKFFKYVLPCLCQEKNKVGADLGPTHHRWRGWINIIVGSVSYGILILHPHCLCLIWVYDYVSKEATGKAYGPSKTKRFRYAVVRRTPQCQSLGGISNMENVSGPGWLKGVSYSTWHGMTTCNMFRHNKSKAVHARRWGFWGKQWTSRWLPHQPLRWAHSQLTGAGG